MRWIAQWILSAVALMITVRLVPGFYITGTEASLIGALGVGLLNAILGYFLNFVNFPLVILTFGAFILFVNAAVLIAASRIIDGFSVYGYTPAIWAGAVLAVLSLIIRYVAREE